MALRTLSLLLLLILCSACSDSLFRPVFTEQRLMSGKVVKVTSCQLVWGVEHEDRQKDKDAYALEYVSTVSPDDVQELDREALEVFELIRPLSEQWGFSTASVAAFSTLERSGKYFLFTFARAADGRWSFKRTAAKVFNTESGHKPGHA